MFNTWDLLVQWVLLLVIKLEVVGLIPGYHYKISVCFPPPDRLVVCKYPSLTTGG